MTRCPLVIKCHTLTTCQLCGLPVQPSSATLTTVAEIRSAANTHGDARRAKINSNSNRGSRQNGFIKCTCIFIYKLVSVRKRVINALPLQSEHRRIFSSVLSVPKCNYRAQSPAASFVCFCCCCCCLHLLFLGANILCVCVCVCFCQLEILFNSVAEIKSCIAVSLCLCACVRVCVKEKGETKKGAVAAAAAGCRRRSRRTAHRSIRMQELSLSSLLLSVGVNVAAAAAASGLNSIKRQAK